MKTTKINVTLTPDGIQNAIRELRRYEERLRKKVPEFLDRLAQEGYDVARVGFLPGSYIYDGSHYGVTVNPPERRGENEVAIVATGETVLFIEFGTGVSWVDNHPEKPSNIDGRGEYGKRHGKQPTWGYYGDEAGTYGRVIKKANGRNVVLTHGNPANAPMYNAEKAMRERYAEIAREVFGSDG